MKNLESVLKSVIESYNNNEVINYVDLKFINESEELRLGRSFVNGLIASYNRREKLNFIDVRDLENAIKKVKA